MSLIRYGEFRAHSGGLLPWKIDADALSDDDIMALAAALLAYEQPGNPMPIFTVADWAR